MTQDTFITLIQEDIQQVEARMLLQANGHHPELGVALKHLLFSGGKRVRPAVALLTGGMLGAEKERLITLGAAIEMLHTATLVHDDLIDGALLRRGIATLNAQWSPAATVLTGDFIFARAAKLAAETDSIPVMHLFSETLATIVNGEITQMFTSSDVASLENYCQRIYAKTASLFEVTTTAAAILSPVADEVVEEARCFGYEIGMAFQIVDDILDFTGKQATVGKPVASDLRQGLITLPAIYYLEMHPEDPEMESLMNGHFYSDERMDQLVQSIRQSGAIQESMGKARQHVESALNILIKQPDCPERHALEDLALYIVNRRM
ncbi:MAG: polyprenyl synthetase family protein [Anaerolineales bacterium]|nr:polyprenyl synthetase family protein [Anaerolineales bacterium]